MKSIWLWVIVIIIVAIFGIYMMYMVQKTAESKARWGSISDAISNIGIEEGPKRGGLGGFIGSILAAFFGTKV